MNTVATNIFILLLTVLLVLFISLDWFKLEIIAAPSAKGNASSLFLPNDQPYAFFRKLPTTRQNITPSMINVQTTLVKTKPQFLACNAPKTGCTTWKYFFEFVNTGKRWNSSEIKHKPSLIYRYFKNNPKKINGGFKYNYSEFEIRTMLANLEMVAVGRNPYVRFLSSYQDWLQRAKTARIGFVVEPTFGKFADEFLKLKKGNNSNKFFVDTPINHIDTVTKFCQIGMHNYTLLRVEEQALWFNQFLKKYHLKEKMDEYTSYGNLVFSSGLSEGSSIKDFTAQISGRESWPSEIFTDNHHRGSSEKLSQYYNPTIAKVVTEIVYDDLMNFGYPLWNGVANNFILV